MSQRPNLPIIGLIGPTNLERISAASGISLDFYRRCAVEAGRAIAESGAIVALVPDRGVAVHGLKGYRDAGGQWVIGLLPDGGPSDAEATSNCAGNAVACEEILEGFTWHHQHANLCLLCDLFVCVGMSCGTMAEIVWTKWTKQPPVLVVAGTITNIPTEILAETHVTSVQPQDLGQSIAAWLADMRHPSSRALAQLVKSTGSPA